jgi:excinuclease ABC subunit B
VRKKVTDILDMVRARGGEGDGASTRGRGRGRGRGRQAATTRSAVFDLDDLPPDDLGRLVQTLQEEMHEAAKDLRFEQAARLRDEISELRRELREFA